MRHRHSTALSRLAVISAIILSGCLRCFAAPLDEMRDSICALLSTADARVGVAVVSQSGVVEINGSESFPMMSVVKFPLALAVAEKLRSEGRSLNDEIEVTPRQLHTDTWSPMLREYAPTASHRISLRRLLEYALQQSDNNACDILIEYVGGTVAVAGFLSRHGVSGIDVLWNEDDMHRDVSRSYENASTPLAMAHLLRDFDLNAADSIAEEIKRIMESCATGADRLARPLAERGATIGHKTGTGFTDPETRRINAVNDAGYVHLPDGTRYAIAVFIADPASSPDEAAALIARISATVAGALTQR